MSTHRPAQKAAETLFIYALRDPESLEVRYIGLSVDPRERLISHLSEARSGIDSPKCRWLRTLLQRGLSPRMDILACVPREQGLRSEKGFIEGYFESSPLTNRAGLPPRGREQVGARLSKDLVAKLGHIAIDRDQTLNDLLEEALVDWYERQPERQTYGPIARKGSTSAKKDKA
jgi:hypothetical protein